MSDHTLSLEQQIANFALTSEQEQEINSRAVGEYLTSDPFLQNLAFDSNSRFYELLAGDRLRARIIINYLLKWFIHSDNHKFKLKHWDSQEEVYRFAHSTEQIIRVMKEQFNFSVSRRTVDGLMDELKKLGLFTWINNKPSYVNGAGRKITLCAPVRNFTLNYEKFIELISELADNSFSDAIAKVREHIQRLTKKAKLVFAKTAKSSLQKLQSPSIYSRSKETSYIHMEGEDANAGEKPIAAASPHKRQEPVLDQEKAIAKEPNQQSSLVDSESESKKETSSANVDSLIKKKDKEKAIAKPKRATAKIVLSDENISCWFDSNSGREIHLAVIDPLVNTESKKEVDAYPTPITVGSNSSSNIKHDCTPAEKEPPLEAKEKTKMGKHIPEGDKHFNNKQQQPQIRKKTKMNSTLGMSGLETIDELEECRDRVLEYYIQICDFESATKKTDYEIYQLRNIGIKSQLIKEHLAGEILGSNYCQEYEYLRGMLHPLFESYLRHQLRLDKDTPERTQTRVFWHKKDPQNLKEAWAECKRVLKAERPKLDHAISIGIDPYSTTIPHWVISAHRTETKVEEIKNTALILGNIAVHQNKKIEQHQEQIKPSEEVIEQLPNNHPIIDLLRSQSVLEIEPPSAEEINFRTDLVMDEVANQQPNIDPETNEQSEPMVEYMPAPEPYSEEKDPCISLTQEIEILLRDPITREKGIMLANKERLPLLYNNEGIAIGIDKITKKDDEQDPAPDQGKNNYPLYNDQEPMPTDKTPANAWDAARAKLNFPKKNT